MNLIQEKRFLRFFISLKNILNNSCIISLRRKEKWVGRNRSRVLKEGPVLERKRLRRISILLSVCDRIEEVEHRRLVQHYWDVYYPSLDDPLPHNIRCYRSLFYRLRRIDFVVSFPFDDLHELLSAQRTCVFSLNNKRTTLDHFRIHLRQN